RPVSTVTPGSSGAGVDDPSELSAPGVSCGAGSLDCVLGLSSSGATSSVCSASGTAELGGRDCCVSPGGSASVPSPASSLGRGGGKSTVTSSMRRRSLMATSAADGWGEAIASRSRRSPRLRAEPPGGTAGEQSETLYYQAG